MKFPIPNSQFPMFRGEGMLDAPRRCHFPGRHPAIADARSGIALVITLIMLSVTLVMAIAFLAVARRGRASATTVTDITTARLATESGAAALQGRIVANIFSSGAGPYNFGRITSENYMSSTPFTPGLASVTNVNYLDASGNYLTGLDAEQNIANLYYLPRVPVFVSPAEPGPGRFYADLNRNRAFDLSDDPQWIGILERPDAPHGPNNRFISRYSFFAQPVGNALDLNYIHNQVFNQNLGVQDGYHRNQGIASWEINLAAFLADLNTNQWNPPTIFNPAVNPYVYQQPAFPNSGVAFEDAMALLRFRYAGNYNNLGSVQSLLGPPGVNAFISDNLDGYSDGPLQTGIPKIDETIPANQDQTAKPWPGSDNPNKFFNASDLFNPAKTSAGFVNRLTQSSASTNYYDSSTYYRLMDQLGVDSDPDAGKMHLNYDNLDLAGNVVPGKEMAFIPWTPLRFYTNAADRLLRAYSAEWFKASPANYLKTYYGINYPFPVQISPGDRVEGLTNAPYFGITNQIPAFGLYDIPVYVNGQFVYSPAINRVLQVAANIYDASTNNAPVLGKDFPSVFRPVFTRDSNGLGTNLFISGFDEVVSVVGPEDMRLSTPVDPMSLALAAGAVTNIPVNVYGVPWILGAKKGFPGFNSFVMENIFGITRRLQVTREMGPVGAPARLTGTNQMYTMSVKAAVGVNFWNSYLASYSGSVTGQVRLHMAMALTNDDPGFHMSPLQPVTMFGMTNGFGTTLWPGTAPWTVNTNGESSPNRASFIAPLYNTVPLLGNAVYRTGYATAGQLFPAGYGPGPCFVPTFLVTNNYTLQNFETNLPGFPFPNFGQLSTNRLQVFLLDRDAAGAFRVIDYGHFKQETARGLNKEIFTDNPSGTTGGVWDLRTNQTTKVPYGIENQLKISRGIAAVSTGQPNRDAAWDASVDPQAIAPAGGQQAMQTYFELFFQPYGSTRSRMVNWLTSMQAPYSPTRYAVTYTFWQANDPLVHTMAGDMTPSVKTPAPTHFNPPQTITPLTDSTIGFGSLNNNFQPWGGNPRFLRIDDANKYDARLKDPLVFGSDYWNFPSGKYPSIGWLGRVHRGSPWQTIYLKSSDLPDSTWAKWTGNNSYVDANNAAPVQDAAIFDLFTARLNDNGARGTLSVNQSGLAAWSAVFSGIAVPTNNFGGYTLVQPAAVNGVNGLVQIWDGINSRRVAFRNSDNLKGVFERVGDILSTPQLSFASPYLMGLNPDSEISDAMYEWLPQQTLGLLRVGRPRYVAYIYGQALRPAPNGTVMSGAHFGMVTNYQVVAESAARAVIRVENPTSDKPRVVVESYNVLPPE